MSRHYKPGESDELDFFRPSSESRPRGERESLADANDDPSEDLEDMDGPESDDDRAGVL